MNTNLNSNLDSSTRRTSGARRRRIFYPAWTVPVLWLLACGEGDLDDQLDPAPERLAFGQSLPAPWQTQNVGNVALAGSAGHANGTFSVSGSGADIFGPTDAFRFVYQPLQGKVTLVARVASQVKSSQYAKAGVMVRETLAAGSRHAMMAITPGHAQFLFRSTTGASTTVASVKGTGAPCWVKLVRSGNSLTGSVSPDGQSWQQIGSANVAMASAVHVGLAVSAQNNSALSPSSFDHVTVTRSSQPGTACSRFHPGHYAHIDTLAMLKTTLAKDVHNFVGVHYNVPWGAIETSQGAYDFSDLDQAIALAKSKQKYLLAFFRDRTFHTGCNSKFIPDYIGRSVGYDFKTGTVRPELCYATIWEAQTIDHEIRVLKQILTRYSNEPYFLGFSIQEESVAAKALVGRADLRVGVYAQHRRLYAAVHAAAPGLIVHQMMNWPYNGEISHFSQSADVLVGLGGGGAMGWPDSVPSKAKLWSWYQLARDYNKKLAVIAHAQTPYIGSSLAATEEVYNFLVNDINAHMIVWGVWHKEIGGAYFADRVIPVVNAHGGKVKNTTCPWP